MKTALILGVNGQDGSYLADVLLERGYRVHGAHRRSSGDNLGRIRHCRDRLHLHRFDLADGGSVARLLHDVSPTEVYHVADQDHVGTSWETPEYSVDVTAGGTLRVLDAVRTFDDETADRRCDRKTRVYVPVSATVFGDAPAPQTEDSPTDPQSPYAACKLAAWNLARTYRRKYGMFVSCGVLYNHDSPRRGPGYLLGDLVRGALRVKHGLATTMEVGDLNAYVDIGHARDYMTAAVKMLQLSEPDDFVLSSGEVWTVADVVAEVKAAVGHDASVVETKRNPNRNGSRLMGDHRKATRAFGFAPVTPLQGTIAEVVAEISKEFK